MLSYLSICRVCHACHTLTLWILVLEAAHFSLAENTFSEATETSSD